VSGLVPSNSKSFVGKESPNSGGEVYGGGGGLPDRTAAGGAPLGSDLPHHAARRLPSRRDLAGLPRRRGLRRRLGLLPAARPPAARGWGAFASPAVQQGAIPPPRRPPRPTRRRPYCTVLNAWSRREISNR
jgi:hypothetical protein